jgi:hypothetical protein
MLNEQKNKDKNEIPNNKPDDNEKSNVNNEQETNGMTLKEFEKWGCKCTG